MKRYCKGQTTVLVALAIPVLIGATALGGDVAVEYYNWVQLQKAADAGALAGANYLPDNPTQAIATAQQFAQQNGVQSSEITATSVANGNGSVTITVKRTVPYFFATVFGLTSNAVSASATAGPQYPPNTVNATTPGQVPSGGDNNGNDGTYGSSTGANALLPIGLNSNTTYTDGAQYPLQQGQTGPGNWDLLALGGVGGNNLRGNIANGYNGEVTVGDWVTTEPGKKVGPVDQGIQDRLTVGQDVDPGGTYASHTLTDPRVVVFPVVDWQNGNGRTSVQVKAFASAWIDSYSQGVVTVNFISQVMANTFGSSTSTAPNFGTRGSPALLN
jgi:Flp pilus assembly protein TadG